MVPLAGAIQRIGHEVVFATAREFGPDVAGAGFELLPVGLGVEALRDEAVRTVAGFAALPPDRQAARMFLEIAPRRVYRDLLPAATQWRPDLILREETELGGVLTAARLNVPHVTLGWPAPRRPPAMMRHSYAAVATMWREYQLPRIRAGELDGSLFLDPCPPTLQSDQSPRLCPTAHVRPEPFDAPVDPASLARLKALPSRPTWHVTLGTVSAYNNAPGLLTTIVAAVAPLDVNVVVTIGDELDVLALREWGDRIHVERYIPHGQLLRWCDAVIGHGGCGTTISALCFGLPLIIVPRGGAVQYRNAAACERAGVARVVQDHERSVERVRAHATALLTTPSYRVAAQRVAAEIQSMPASEAVVPLLEEVVRHRAADSRPRADRGA